MIGVLEAFGRVLQVVPRAHRVSLWVNTGNMGALVIAYKILGVLYYNYSIMGSQKPIELIKASILHSLQFRV